MSSRNQMWNIVKDMEKFVLLNASVIKDEKFPPEQRKWFLKVDHDNAIIAIHPQGGLEDIKEDVSKFAYGNNPNPLPSEIAGARKAKWFWHGPFKDLYSAYGYACLVKRFYQMRTGQEMPVRSGYTEEFNFSIGGVSF